MYLKSYKPSLTFKILLVLVFTLFFLVVGSFEYYKITTDRTLVEKILTNHRQALHFDIYSNLDTETIEYYVQFLEGFYYYINEEYFKIGQKKPLKVYLFADFNSYKWYAERVNANTAYGFYMGKHENIIVVNHESGLGTATHELIHHFIATSFARKPAKWVNEGIATFFEKFIGHLDDEKKLYISFGYFSNWRFPLAKLTVKAIDLNEMIKAKRPEQCAARSLMVFLNKKGVFKDFVREISKEKKDRDGSTTLERVYGKPITEIEKEWKEWMEQQPIDDDVLLVPAAFVLRKSDWEKWWADNQDRLYWSEDEQIYRVKKKVNPAPRDRAILD